MFQISRRRASSFALMLLLGSAGVDLLAQRDPRIVGFVRLPPGETKYPDLMNVSLQTIDGGYVKRVTLHGEGSFLFERLQRGQYMVIVESPGFEPGSARAELVGPYTSPELTVIVQLGKRIVKAADTPPHGGDQTVAVEELQIPPKAQRELDNAARASAKGQTEKAIGHLRKALEIEPRLPQAQNNLAVEYMKLGRLAEAAAALEESVRLKPEETASLRNLARLHVAMERWESAEELLKRALELDSESPETLNSLGEVNIAFGRFDEALEFFLRASELNGDQRSYIGIGQCYSLLGRLEESLAEFEEFDRRFPADPRVPSVQIIIAQIKKDLGRE